MMQGWVSIALLVILLALLPLGLKWVQRRVAGSSVTQSATTKIVSAIAVGPHERVVTVETGPQGERVWLTLGVTAQQISCLHTAVAPSSFQGEQGPVDYPTTSVKH